ncbi:exonuclease domain-containing protein [Ferrimonas gelatinilytica]|uniref:Exonuclease domain-containing protein n=1 Tax=Ferrimonas gelatinilytica TaxID=1255257 RepID=A0ABP9RYK3_9GAMM
MRAAWRHFWYRRRSRHPALTPYYRAERPQLGRDYREAPLLALDLELTGLDPQRDRILSIASVPIDGGRVQLAHAWHQLVRIDGEVGQSCTIHGIRDRDMAQGLPLCEALTELLPRLSGRVVICHNATLDRAFLRRGFLECFGERPPLLFIDTLLLEQQRFARRGATPHGDGLRLGSCRERYGLPVYPGHNALVDAIACGELLLAQCSEMAGRDPLKIGALIA